MTSLNNTYIIQNKPLKQLLDNIDNFITNISKFKEKHNGYDYTIEVTNNKKDKDFYDAEITIKYEKQRDIETIKEMSHKDGLL